MIGLDVTLGSGTLASRESGHRDLNEVLTAPSAMMRRRHVSIDS
jgi:hypothetical protein